MPVFSLFVLVLYVFLQSAPAFGWFTVDPKLQAIVGIAFVISVLVEVVLYARAQHPLWRRPQ